MTTLSPPRPDDLPDELVDDGRPGSGSTAASTLREDTITVAAGLWLMVGLFVDGWAHLNLTELETFFTPWHGLFYSGFAVTGGWMLLVLQRRRRGGASLREAVPAGYGLGFVGLAVFALGGVGDAIWHTFLGIEVDLDALYSPTHVLLFAGMVLVLTSPVRAAWHRVDGDRAPSWRVFAPALGGATLTAAVLTFAFMYWSPQVDVWASSAHHAWALDNDLGDLSLLMGTAALFTTTLLLVGTYGLLLRRWMPPRGAATVLFTVPTLLASALAGFAHVDLVLTAVVAGGLTDVLVTVLRPAPERPWSVRLTMAAAAFALTSTYLTGVWLTRGTGWAPEFTFGVTAWATALGLGLGTLLVPPPVPVGLGSPAPTRHDG